MSVTSGKFFNGTTSYVGGAPRANGTGVKIYLIVIKKICKFLIDSYLTGQVVFFSKQKGESTFDKTLILSGEQFASSYGYSMTSLDSNGDGSVLD